MLEKILAMIYRHQPKDLNTLARLAGLSVIQVQEGLRQLERLGLIKDERPVSCSGGCSGCSMSCGDRLPRMIALTEKGRLRAESIDI